MANSCDWRKCCEEKPESMIRYSRQVRDILIGVTVGLVLCFQMLLLVGCQERTPPTTPAGCAGVSDIVISVPAQGDTVPPVLNAQGKVPDPKSAVWVVVNPHESASQFWVEDEAVVTADCTWTGPVHFAENSPQFSSQKFDVMAVGGPRQPLHKAEVLSSWPIGKWNSKVVTVARQ